MIAIVFGLGSALLWGVSDFLGGLVSRRIPPVTVTLISQACALALLAVVVLATQEALPHGVELAAAAGAGVAVAFGVYCFYAALAGGHMGAVAPVGAAAVTLPVAFGLATGEQPSTLQFLGAAMATIGVVLVSRSTTTRSGADRRAMLLAFGAAAGFGLFYVGLDGAAAANLFAVLFVVRGVAVVMLMAAAGVTRPSMRVSGRTFLVIALLGLLDLAANAAYLIATSKGLIIVASVLVSLYAVVTILLARAVLSERMSAAQVRAIVIALGGVALIAAGA